MIVDKILEYYCEENQIQVVLPKQARILGASKEWIVIGYSGVDGIDFRVNNESKNTAVYAYYPIENEYYKMSESIEELVSKWKANQIIL